MGLHGRAARARARSRARARGAFHRRRRGARRARRRRRRGRLVVEYNNRVLVVAPTRGGKSELLNVLASGLRSQWALIDPKDEFAIAGVEKVHDVEQLAFADERVLHWVPPPEPAVWERFFQRAWELRR